MAEIDNLSISISASTQDAIANLDRLASSLGRFRGASRNAAQSARDATGAVRDMGTGTADSAERVGEAANSVTTFGQRLRAATAPLRAFGVQLGTTVVQGAGRAVSAVTGLVGGMARIARFRIYRTIIKDLGQSFKDLYGYSDAFGIRYASSIDKITTATTYLRNSIAAMVAPLVNMLAPVLDTIIDKVVEALNWFNQLFAAIGGQKTYTVAKKIAIDYGDTLTSTTKKVKKDAEEIKKTILGFDEINKLQKDTQRTPSSSTGKSPYSDNYKLMFEERKVSGGFKGFGNAIEKAMSDTMSRISLIVSGATLALGAILAFSGANVPLGIGLMIAGASGLASTIAANWTGLSPKVKLAITAIESVLGGGLLAIGAVLAFSGSNVPLGIGLMLSGAATLGAAVGLNWGTIITSSVSNVLKNLAVIVGGAALGIGAVLAFSGANIPLGIGLMAAGFTAAASGLVWGNVLTSSIANVLMNIMSIVSPASLAVGAILAFSGANVPAGIALMAAGVVGIAASLMWGNLITSSIQNVLANIAAILGPASLAVGAVLAFSGVNVPIGIAMMGLGVAGMATSIVWGTVITNSVKNVLVNIESIVGPALIAIGTLLALSGVAVPVGIAMIAGGIATTASAIVWGKDVGDGIDGTIKALKKKLEPVGGTAIALGALLCLSGVAVPLGIGLIAGGIAIVAQNVDWEYLPNKLSEVWNTITTNTSEKWAKFKEYVADGWASAKTSFNNFRNWLSSTFSVDWSSAWSTIVTNFGNVFNKIKEKAKAPINAVIDFINKLITKVNAGVNKIIGGINSALSISIPPIGFWDPWGNWRGTSAWSWSPNLRTVSWNTISRLATGGILTSPTMLSPNVMAGEAGREAVLPLDAHTEWMDAIADRIYHYDDNKSSGDSGVMQTMLEQMRSMLDEMRKLNAKDFTTEVTTSNLTQALNRANRRAGTTIVPVGT